MDQARSPGSMPTPADVVEILNNIQEVLTGTGKHADHKQKQLGRCVYCSCGQRYQGNLPKGKKNG